MAENIVGSLFGISPLDVEEQLRTEQMQNAFNIARLNPAQRNVYTGQMIGGALSKGILGAFGVQDPRLTRASTIESVLQEVNANLTDEEKNDPSLLYSKLADALSAKGLNNEATMARFKAQEAGMEYTKKQAEVEKLNAETIKAAREKLGAFAQDLLAAGYKPGSPEWIAQYQKKLDKDTNIPDKIKRSAFAQELLDAGYKEGSDAFNSKMGEYIQSQIEGKKKGEGTTISIGGISVDTGKLSEEYSKKIGEQASQIQGKYDAVDALDNSLEKLSSGIYAGQFGKAGKFIAKASGGLLGDSKRVANTEVFLANIGSVVIPMLKDFGGNDSNEELRYLQGVVGGDISLEPAAIEEILKSAKKKIKKGIQRLRQQTTPVNGKAPTISTEPIVLDEGGGTTTPTATMRWDAKSGKLVPITR